MTNPTIKIHNAETNEVVEREMTKAENDALIKQEANSLAKAENAAIKAAEKAALLARLGLTADEAKLLLS